MTFDLSPEQAAYQTAARAFAAEHVAPVAAGIDERDDFPRPLVAELGTHGYLGATTPIRWGGQGRDYLSYALAIEALAQASATVAVIVAVQNSLVAEPVAQFGLPAQQERWLSELASGRAIGAFALSEQHAGTDAANQQTTATPDGQGYRLNGRKVWVANAEAADLVLLFAATEPGIGGRGVSAFLVPLETPGLTRIRMADSLGVRGLGCRDIELQDVRVESDQRLGEPGQGFRIAMWALDGGRVAIAAQALGVGQAALGEAIRHAKRRHTFGQPIARYQSIQWMLADMATELDAARMLMLKSALAKSTQPRVSLEAAMAKLFASEAAHRAADRSMQILASSGYRRSSRVERLFRDIRATEIYQGTSEVQRMVIASEILGARP